MSELADVAALVADRTRARILEELLAGPPMPASALALRTGVAPSTVSGHLAKLEKAGLIVVKRRGRWREAQLARPEVAEALEALSRLSVAESRPIGLRAVNARLALREARSCYDHLAGRAGVELADELRGSRGTARAGRRVLPASRRRGVLPRGVRDRMRTCRGGVRWCGRARTGPSAGRTWRVRWARRCWMRCWRTGR